MKKLSAKQLYKLLELLERLEYEYNIDISHQVDCIKDILNHKERLDVYSELISH